MRTFIVFCLTLLVSAFPAAAFNPSFDCQQATGALQKVICSDYTLSRADRFLAGINATIMSRNEPNTLYFITRQEQWFAALDKTCAVKSMGAAAKNCLLDAYESRKAELRSLAGCSRVTAQQGAQTTINENSYAMVPQGTHVLMVASSSHLLLSGDFNTINIRHGKAVVTLPAGAQEPFTNLVNSCTVKRRP